MFRRLDSIRKHVGVCAFAVMIVLPSHAYSCVIGSNLASSIFKSKGIVVATAIKTPEDVFKIGKIPYWDGHGVPIPMLIPNENKFELETNNQVLPKVLIRQTEPTEFETVQVLKGEFKDRFLLPAQEGDCQRIIRFVGGKTYLIVLGAHENLGFREFSKDSDEWTLKIKTQIKNWK